MGIYACPRCGNPNGWWSGNMRDVHDCPGPPLRQWPGLPAELDWSEPVADHPLKTTPVVDQKPASVTDNANGVPAPTDSRDAARYRWLRTRDLDAVRTGGVFAGMTPQNVVLNGEDLDRAVDEAMAQERTPRVAPSDGGQKNG